MTDEIKEIIDSYRDNKTPKNVERALREYSCVCDDSPGIIRDDYFVDRGNAFLPMSEVDVKSFSMHDTLADDKEKLLKILLRYIADVSKSEGNELSPYWICFAGFEGENGDLSKEEYELLMKYKGKLWE